MRIPTTKAGRPHLLPLPTAAVEILKALPRSSEYVFPGTGASGHLTEAAKVWQRIRKRAGVPDARIHDLRRTLGSWLVAQGHSLPLIGRALNHTNMSTTQIYVRLDLEPVRDALEKNAGLMFGIALIHHRLQPSEAYPDSRVISKRRGEISAWREYREIFPTVLADSACVAGVEHNL